MIDQMTEQKIKNSANIVEVMSDFLVLRREGARYTCLCPFHEDRHLGSFSIYPRGNVYKCFSCDAGGDSIQFLMDYAKMTYKESLLYLAHKYGIFVDEQIDKEKLKNAKPAKPRDMMEAIDNRQPRVWPASIIGYFRNLENDNLVKWLRSLNLESHQLARLEEALNDYHVSHCHFISQNRLHEWTIWWQLDEQNRLHNGHFMKYRADGHRDKEDPYNQTWLHARMKYARENPFDEEKERASYCLFGQHLLNAWPNATVNIVESEKTAVIMAALYGNHAKQIWMACGGLHNLTRERLAPIIDKHLDIQLFPDKDGIAAWKRKATELRYNYVNINTNIIDTCWVPEDGPKADIADIVLRLNLS